jgi:hypothetical protein
MKINEAISIIEDAGLLLERIKKYRTTTAERDFRDNRSAYDHESIRDEMRSIAEEEGIGVYVDGVGFKGDYGSPDQSIWVEFRNIGDFGKRLVDRLSKAVGADRGTYRDMLYFKFGEISKQSQKELTFLNLLEKMLYDRFGIPRKAFNKMSNYWELDQWLEVAKENYDVIEKFIEEEQYVGIHGLNYRKFIQTVKDAYAAAKSPENRDKYVSNRYGFRKRIDEIYAKFRKFCRLFKREFERQRGNLTKPAEV